MNEKPRSQPRNRKLSDVERAVGGREVPGSDEHDVQEGPDPEAAQREELPECGLPEPQVESVGPESAQKKTEQQRRPPALPPGTDPVRRETRRVASEAARAEAEHSRAHSALRLERALHSEPIK